MSEQAEVVLERCGLLLALIALAWAAWGAESLPGARPVLVARGAPIDAAPLSGQAAERQQVWSDPAPGERVSLERLAFDDYDPPELRPEPEALLLAADFPAAAAGLDGKQLSFAGFPLVLALEERGTESLLLTRYPPGCCFGSIPVLDEWVLVELEEPVALDELPGEVVVRGRFEVGELLDESGAVDSLYRLRAARLESE